MPESEAFIAHTNKNGEYQSLADHAQGTARRAAEFAAQFGAEAWGRAAGYLHDAGKCSPEFQAYLCAPDAAHKVDHSTAAAKIAMAAGLIPIAFVTAGHHTGLPDGGSACDTSDCATLFGRVKRTVPDYSRWQQALPPFSLKGLALPFSLREPFTASFFTRMLYSCLVDADYLDTEAFMQADAAPRGGGAPLSQLLEKMRRKADSWLNAPNQSPMDQARNRVLRACLDHGRSWPQGLYTLTVPTGGSKTFSSLAFSLEHAVQRGADRLVYVIPYTSIIDQTVEVFSGILGSENVLAHYSGADYQLLEQDQMSPEDYRRALAAENWDAPVIVTTAVQFFESLFSNRSSRCRKLHNLANSVIVFDEAQTIPIGYLRPCVAAIAQLVEHYRATAILCTATQPVLGPLFAEFAPGLSLREICPGVPELYRTLRRTTLLDLGTLSAADLAARLAGHRQVLCVVNHRRQAQELYGTLPQEGSFCLTTLLCAADRRVQLAEIRSRLRANLPCRVVSTSLIEAGVDVNFPVAYREQAGLDSLLQTAGRCNREGTRSAAESPVYLFELANSPKLTLLANNISALQAILRTCPELDTPAVITQYFNALLTVTAPGDLDQTQILSAFQHSTANGSFPFASVAKNFSLINSPTLTIYLPIGEGAELCARLQSGSHSRALYRALGMYSLSVYQPHFSALHCAGALQLLDEGSAILADTSLYNARTGLALDVQDGQAWMI